MIPMREPVTEFRLEAPAGLIGIRADCQGGKVTQVTFTNVPAFAAHLDAVIDVPTLGEVTIDVGWGGMFYVIADVDQFDGLALLPERGAGITRISALILRAAHPSTWTGALDRCPCGTGTSAKVAVLHAKGELELGRPFRQEGLLGTVYTGELVAEADVGGRPGVVPTISGQAWISGFSNWVLDPTDSFIDGFMVGDLWA